MDAVTMERQHRPAINIKSKLPNLAGQMTSIISNLERGCIQSVTQSTSLETEKQNKISSGEYKGRKGSCAQNISSILMAWLT